MWALHNTSKRSDVLRLAINLHPLVKCPDKSLSGVQSESERSGFARLRLCLKGLRETQLRRERPIVPLCTSSFSLARALGFSLSFCILHFTAEMNCDDELQTPCLLQDRKSVYNE